MQISLLLVFLITFFSADDFHEFLVLEQIAEGLTNSEALAIERLLINQSRENDLWNVKDYEPFSTNDDKGLTDGEVLEMLSARVQD